jgi:DNA mismatch repair protein MutS2
MEFDLATLSPTFRLNMGNPGRSNAFEIASKLGLDKKIVDHARELLDGETVYFDDVMEQIERDRGEAAKHLAETEKEQEKAKAVLSEIENKQNKAEHERETLLLKAREEADRIISDASYEADTVREELKALIKDVRTRGVADGIKTELAESPVDAGDVLRKADESKKRLKKAAPLLQGDLLKKKKGTGQDLIPGDIVALPGSDNTGEVLTAPDDRGRVIVRSGFVKLTLPANELIKQEQSADKQAQQGHRYAKIVMSKMGHVKQSIDLHGKNLDEAEMLVDKYLDDAILARMHEIVINHGRGSGILRDGIRKMLRKSKHVKSFRDGSFDEGGDGVTIVTLSEK